MPIADKRVWDGHSKLLGVDTFSDPSQLEYFYCTAAVNKSFRKGEISTRPPFRSLSLSFDTEENKEIFEKGNITGAIAYDNTYEGTQSHLVIAVADRILKGRIYADTIEFSLLISGIDPKLTSYFVQAEDRVYWQNGKESPIGWDGIGDAYRIEGGIAEDKMPIGTIMAFAQGRLVILGEKNHLFVSDFIYGNGLTPESPKVESFIEIQANNDLGAIASPFSVGPIRSITPIPVTPSRNAQGDLLVLGDKGGYTLDITGERASWFASDILQIVLTSGGASSAFATVAANNDLWFRRFDGGIGSYSFERSEQTKAWGNTSLSREVSDYLRFDDPEKLRFCSAMVAHNRLLMSTGLGISPNETDGFGPHKFGKGMVSLDFDKGSTINRKVGFSWDGLWTGVNPVSMVSVLVDNARRPLILSHDDDGVNRIYEALAEGGDDQADGIFSKIESSHETVLLLDQPDTRQEQGLKILEGIHLEISDVYGSAEITGEYSPNRSDEWFTAGNRTVGQDGLSQSTDENGVNVVGDELKDFYDIVTIGLDEKNAPEQGNERVSTRARGFRIRISLKGKGTIPILQISASLERDSFFAACNSDDTELKYSKGVRVAGENIFSYSIVKSNG